MLLAPLSAGFQSLPPLSTIKLGPLVLIPGWVGLCTRARTLLVSPTTSPVRLGVPPAAASTHAGVFSQRFEAFFPCAGALGCAVCLTP